MFCECKPLNSFPNTGKWRIVSVIDFSYMFYGCKSLTVAPVISGWNTGKKNCKYNHVFEKCKSNLENIPDFDAIYKKK